MLRDTPLDEFCRLLASEEPVPGGGSASAAAASLGAGLLVMTCNLTVGRERFRDAQAELTEARDELEAMRVWFLASVDRDSEAYDGVMQAFSMPKGTPEEKQARREAIQAGMRRAAEVPMDVARRCRRALELAPQVASLGNPNALSDAGVGARLLEAALHGALYNVSINLSAIKDQDYVARMGSEVEALRKGAAGLMGQVLQTVESEL